MLRTTVCFLAVKKSDALANLTKAIVFTLAHTHVLGMDERRVQSMAMKSSFCTIIFYYISCSEAGVCSDQLIFP